MPANINSPSAVTGGLPDHIPSLDGLRALSVLLVIAGHAALYGPATPRWQLFSLLFFNAEIGVTCFFVISGFLITTLLLREKARTNQISFRKFFLRRALRILPPFYVLILAVVLLKYFGGLAIPGQRIWTAATFSYNIIKHPSWGSWWLGHTWSLSVEEQFYLCWPFLLVILGKKTARKAAIALILIAPIFRVAMILRHPEFANQISGLLPSRMDALMLGALAALSFDTPILNRLLTKLSGSMISVLTGFIFVASPLLTYAFGRIYLFSVGMTLESACLLLVLLFVIYKPSSSFGRVVNAKLMVYTGALSYDIYLWQQLFMTPQNTTFTGIPGINLLSIGVCAYASYTLVGVPLRIFSRKLLKISA